MASKRRGESDSITAPLIEKDTSGNAVAQNAYPRVLGGRPLKQLELPSEFLTMPRKPRPAGTAVTPSNLSQVRAALKARKP